MTFCRRPTWTRVLKYYLNDATQVISITSILCVKFKFYEPLKPLKSNLQALFATILLFVTSLITIRFPDEAPS